ncbi:hypothetical protein ABZY44_25250 [Streptomyces sp. NPDC006544]|uniref:hypothetical protein n=1 Tax=Streptomyces sp. NPDC006544 TaxID=3154583 RepID=UPI0033AA50B3
MSGRCPGCPGCWRLSPRYERKASRFYNNAEWERLAQLLADAAPGTVYDPDADVVVVGHRRRHGRR